MNGDQMQKLNYCAISNRAVLHDHNDAITDIKIKLRAISLFDMILIYNRNIAANPDILIQNRTPHGCSLPNTDGDPTTLTKQYAFLRGFKIIRTHDQGVL